MIVFDKEKVSKHFSKDFLFKVLADLDLYAEKWSLTDFEHVDYYSVNCIFKCKSDKYGLCILKIGDSPENMEAEFRMLQEYNTTTVCRVYDVDIENSVLLIECIEPGTRLRDEIDIDKRLDVFSDLYRGLHKKPCGVFPTYMGWVSRITEYMSRREDYPCLYKHMVKAEEVCKSLCEKYPDAMLLHGDFHHDNILLGEGNRYRVIDPKGVIGDSVFDIPRFILNEFDDELDKVFSDKITYIITRLSEKLRVPEHDIKQLVYVEMCMAQCWMVESNQLPNMGEVLFVKELLDDLS